MCIRDRGIGWDCYKLDSHGVVEPESRILGDYNEQRLKKRGPFARAAIKRGLRTNRPIEQVAKTWWNVDGAKPRKKSKEMPFCSEARVKRAINQRRRRLGPDGHKYTNAGKGEYTKRCNKTSPAPSSKIGPDTKGRCTSSKLNVTRDIGMRQIGGLFVTMDMANSTGGNKILSLG